MRRLVLWAFASVLVVCVAGPSAGALTTDDRYVGGAIVNGAPEAVVVVGHSGTVASWSGSGRGSHWSCGYYAFDIASSGSDGTLATVHYDDGPVDPVPGEAYVLACFDESGRQVRSILRLYDPADPFGGIAATERALDEARRRLDLPAPRPAMNPPGDQLVGLATWLWVDGPWLPATATASIGTVAATVAARPTRVEWDFGDGATVSCGAGTAYDPSRRPDAQQSDCTHVFTHTSAGRPGGTYTVTATVTYDVEWSASTGEGGSLGAVSRSATVTVRVGEAQALIR